MASYSSSISSSSVSSIDLFFCLKALFLFFSSSKSLEFLNFSLLFFLLFCIVLPFYHYCSTALLSVKSGVLKVSVEIVIIIGLCSIQKVYKCFSFFAIAKLIKKSIRGLTFEFFYYSSLIKNIK